MYELHRRHGQQVSLGVRAIFDTHFDFAERPVEQSFLDLIMNQEYLVEPVERLANDIASTICAALPLLFKRKRPENENDLNDTIEAILKAAHLKLNREHPTVRFGLAKSIADHSSPDCKLFVEAKYVRRGTSPSKASEGIAADLTKYPEDKFLLFLVYDPERAIIDDALFSGAFERRRPGNCRIVVVH